MAVISLTRIDSRLIHGQVITKWMRQTNANRIIVVDNKLANDPFMSKIYIMAAPPGVKVEMLTVEDSISCWNKDNLGNGNLLVLFKDVPTILDAWGKGLPITKVQVGGLGSAPGRKVVYNQIALNKEDAESLMKMQEGGVEIYFQTVPEDRPASLDKIIKNLKF